MDHFPDRDPVEAPDHVRLGQRRLAHDVFGGSARDPDRRPQPAVHLHREFDLVDHELALVPGRPLGVIEDARLTAEPGPQLLGDVGRDRRDHDHERPHLVDRGRAPAGAQRVQVVHRGGDRRVVAQRLEVLRDLFDPGVQRPLHAGIVESRAPRLGRGRHAVPHLLQEALRSGQTAVAEIPAPLEGAEEHQVHAERVRAEPRDVFVRQDHVAARLRDLRAVPDEQAVLAEAVVRLLELEVPEIVQHHCEEARVEEVEDGVLLAADVAADG